MTGLPVLRWPQVAENLKILLPKKVQNSGPIYATKRAG